MRIDQHESAENEELEEIARDARQRADAARAPPALDAARQRAAAVVADLKAANFAPPPKATKVSEKLFKALKKPKGTMALIGEGSLQTTISLGGYDLNDPTYLSEQFRVSGAAAVCVRVGGDSSFYTALDDKALEATVKEQAIAKGSFPGPLPVIARGEFVDPLQLAKLAADGADGVLLSVLLNGAEGTASLAEEARAFGLEPIFGVANAAELASALELGARIVSIGECALPEAEELLGSLKSDNPKVLAICDLYTRDVRGAWMARDLGFDAQIASDSILEVCSRDRCPPESVVKAMLMKGSYKYGLGMQKGRLEGAKEVLGDLAM